MFEVAEAYEAMMGRWSRQLAPAFVQFAGVGDGDAKSLKERPAVTQKFVAALAESILFVEKNPEKGKAAVSKALTLNDADALQSAYDAYAKLLVNRRLLVPENTVGSAIEVVREQGTNVRRKPGDIIDNRFAEDLEKSGFLRELWGADISR